METADVVRAQRARGTDARTDGRTDGAEGDGGYDYDDIAGWLGGSLGGSDCADHDP